MKEKLKRQALPGFFKMKENSLNFYQSKGPLHWQNLTIIFNPLYNIFPLKSCAGCCKKSHTNNQTTSNIYHSTNSHKDNTTSGLLKAIKSLVRAWQDMIKVLFYTQF